MMKSTKTTVLQSLTMLFSWVTHWQYALILALLSGAFLVYTATLPEAQLALAEPNGGSGNGQPDNGAVPDCCECYDGMESITVSISVDIPGSPLYCCADEDNDELECEPYGESPGFQGSMACTYQLVANGNGGFDVQLTEMDKDCDWCPAVTFDCTSDEPWGIPEPGAVLQHLRQYECMGAEEETFDDELCVDDDLIPVWKLCHACAGSEEISNNCNGAIAEYELSSSEGVPPCCDCPQDSEGCDFGTVTISVSGSPNNPECGEGEDPGPIEGESGPDPIDGEPGPGGSLCDNVDGGVTAGVVATPLPVDVFHGHKRERAVDVRVPQAGMDYVISRSYSSKPGYESAGLVGRKWTLSDEQRIVFERDSDVCTGSLYGLGGSGGQMFSIDCPQGWPEQIESEGPTDQIWMHTFEMHEGKKLPLWRLHAPGQWSMEFYRKNEANEDDPENWWQVQGQTIGGANEPSDFPLGLLYRVVDAHGNTWEYTYGWNGPSDPQETRSARLESVDLSHLDSSDAHAAIHFTWYIGGPFLGQLYRVRVYRRIDGQSVRTDEVTYRYASEAESHLGPVGSLVQVQHDNRLNVGIDDIGAEPTWRSHFTQYRYHTGLGAGQEGQLKMVIESEQIEYFFDNYSEPFVARSEAAETLLGLDDNYDLLWDDQTTNHLVDLAAKLIEYETTGEGRVLEQYVQSSCGCAGNSSHGRRFSYEYFDNYDSDDTWRSTRVNEQFYSTSQEDWQPLRTTYYDLERRGDVPTVGDDRRVPYLRSQAVIDPDDDKWVTHFLHDESGNLVRRITASAKVSYVPATETTGPVYHFHDDEGLVRAYAYNSEHRRIETRVGQGVLDPVSAPLASGFLPSIELNDQAYDLLETIEYESDPTISFLPKETIRYAGSGGTHPEITRYSYGFFDGLVGADRVAWVEREVDAEGTDENGPGGTYSTHSLFNSRGNEFWTRDAEGSLTYREFDSRSGRVTRVVRNASPDLLDLPSEHGDVNALNTAGWGARFEDGGSLETRYVRDLLGRTTIHIAPTGVKRYTIRDKIQTDDVANEPEYYAEVSLPHELDDGSHSGPAEVRWFTAGGQLLQVKSFEILEPYNFSDNDELGAAMVLGYSTSSNSEVFRQSVTYDITGQRQSGEIWHDVQGDESYVTTYAYDEQGRQAITHHADGGVTELLFDAHDRVVERRVGTDAGATLTVEEYFYDSDEPGEQGSGNGNIRFVRQHVNDQEHRDTEYRYDYRDRHVWTIQPEAPHTYVEYDNLDRPEVHANYAVAPGAGEIDPPPAEDPLTYTETSYSKRGLVYRQRTAIEPADLGEGFLETHTWYDGVGRAVGQWGPNAPMTKTTFDGLGRPAITYTIAGQHQEHHDVYDSANHQADVANDPVIEQVEYGYTEGGGLLELFTRRMRTHDADEQDEGDLSQLSNDKLVITTYSGRQYDSAARPVTEINFGTNQTEPVDPNNPDEPGYFRYGGDAPSMSTEYAAGHEDYIVTETEYDAIGRVARTIDPEQRETEYVYDDMNRRVEVIEDAAGLQRTTGYVYDAASNIIEQIANPSGADEQITEYVYGVSTNDSPHPSEINSHNLLRKVIYPEGDASTSEADRTVTYAYNRLGEMIRIQDQNGTVRESERDALGRQISDSVLTFGQDVDDTYHTIETTYDDLGRMSTVHTFGQSGMIFFVNSVQFAYTPLGEIDSVGQAHGLLHPSGGAPEVKYTYETSHAGDSGPGAVNYSRLVGVEYPSGAETHYEYGMAESIHDLVSRVRSITVDGFVSDKVHYDYIGSNTFAIVDYERPDVQLDRTASRDGSRNFQNQTQNEGIYPAFDRFGRVVQHMWVDGEFQPHHGGSLHTESDKPHVPPILQLTHTYDQASNRLSRDNETSTIAWGHRHEQFDYDGLHRLEEARRGIDDGQTFSHSEELRSQRWSLDSLGNWTEFEEVTNLGCGQTTTPPTFNVLQSRDHTDANEIEQISDCMAGSGSPEPLSLTYDNAGNLRTREIPDPGGSGTIEITYTWDAWNRLVRVEYGSDVRAEYDYNGLNWRITKRADTSMPPDGVLDEERRMYYSANWQLIEEQIDDNAQSSFDADRRMEYFWGARYIDDIVLRRDYADIDNHPNRSLPRYHITDTLFSTVAVLNSAGKLLERVSYDAYGTARHHHPGDLTGDGAVGQDDENAMAPVGEYGVGDISRTGVVDANDVALVEASAAAIAPGEISTTGNTVGYAGYVFNAEHVTAQTPGLYTVRHRHYEPGGGLGDASGGLGRWLSRDPIGYVDGMSLYEYVQSGPVDMLDPFGLSSLGIYRNDRTCRTIATGRKRWRRHEGQDGQQILGRTPVNLPTPGGWVGVGIEIWSTISPPEATGWHNAGRRWDRHERYKGSLIGVACRCKFWLEEEECTVCCVQRQRLVYAPKKKSIWPLGWRDEGDAQIEWDCDFKKSEYRWMYGTLERNAFTNSYTCSCESPAAIARAIAIDLEDGFIPDDFVDKARHALDELHYEDLCCN